MAYPATVNPNWYYDPRNYTWGPYQTYTSATHVGPQNNLIRVTGEEGAKAYPLPPNSSVALFDGNEDLFYVKTTDGAGFPTIRIFRFEEIASKTIEVEASTDDYVSKEEFDNLRSDISKQIVLLEDLRRELGYGEQSVQQPDNRRNAKRAD